MGDFNPRPLAGATGCAAESWQHVKISIHAPLRGRPGGDVFGNVSDMISIHAPLRGRPGCSCRTWTPQKFQSTPPCGGDRWFAVPRRCLYYFNPRPLAGATVFIDPDAPFTAISIHAPLRGRRFSTKKRDEVRAFQSTPPCGGDMKPTTFCPGPTNFNPRPLAGATMQLSATDSARSGFQSTPPCGGDGR